MSEIHELLGKVNQHLDDFNRAVEDERKVTPSSFKIINSDVVRGILKSQLSSANKGVVLKRNWILFLRRK